MKKIIAIALLLSASILSFAQTTVRGTVSDESGDTVPGATILIQGTSIGTITDGEGKYSISVKGEDVKLEFSCIGYEPYTVRVGKQSTINVVLLASTSFIEETVVVGYGTMRKKDMTGSVSSIKSESLENKVLYSVDDALAGGVAGLMVSSSSGRPGAASHMLVRGANSLSGSTAPLIVIDGFPLFDISTSTGGGLNAFDVGMSGLSMINPDDIATIDVLKDASATAIYGNRGANGVILITTKKGKEGTDKIQYSNYIGAQVMNRRYDMMDFDQYVEYQAMYNHGNELIWDSSTNAARDLKGMPTKDWQDEIYRTGFIQNHSLSASHSSKKTNSLISASYMQDKSILICTNWTKFTAKAAVDHYFTDHVRMGIDISLSRMKDEGAPVGGTGGSGAGRQIGVVHTALSMVPYDVRDPQVQAIFRRAGVLQSTLDEAAKHRTSNPVAQCEDTQLEKYVTRTMINGYFEADLMQDLVFRSTLGSDVYGLQDRQYYPTTTGRGDFYKGQGIIGASDSCSWINENTITWRPTFDKHRLNLLAGVSEQKNVSYFSLGTSEQYTYEELGFNSVGKARVFTQDTNKGTTTYLSFMARANYTYDNRFIATFTARRDGTSRFVKNKWGNFFSGALAWNIDQEEFMKSQNTLSTLKLRLSAGQVGNSGVPTTGSYAQLTDARYSFGGIEVVGQIPASIANEGLTWETTTEINLGLETGFLENRYTLNVDLYHKVTDGLILDAPVINVCGFKSAWQNIGKMSNSGIELSMNASIINTRDWKWNFGANFSYNDTKVIELGQNGAPIYLPISCLWGDNVVILREGGSIGDLFGYKAIGVYGVNDFEPDGVTPKPGVAVKTGAERPGVLKMEDYNHDGQITPDDRQVIGNTMPKWFGAFNTTVSWRNLELAMNFQYSVGSQIYNANYNYLAEYNASSVNQAGFWKDHWSPSNPESTMYTFMNAREISSAFVEDNSFLRCRTARLTYTFPRSLFPSKTHIGMLRVFASADNLFVITKYSGYDPEVYSKQSSGSVSGIITSGFDCGCFPRPQTFTGGLSIIFK